MRTQLPYARAGQVIGLLGGSFDPVHEGMYILPKLRLIEIKYTRCQSMFWRSLISLSLACCLASPMAAEIFNYETKNNLQPTQDLACVSYKDVGTEVTPVDLTLGIARCYLEERYEEMAALFLLMRVRGRFDIMRVKDISAHQAVDVINLSVGEAFGDEFVVKLNATLPLFWKNGRKVEEFCSFLKVSPPPSYYPDYMIQHGTGAFLEPEADAIVEGFSPPEAWEDIVTNYMRCP